MTRERKNPAMKEREQRRTTNEMFIFLPPFHEEDPLPFVFIIISPLSLSLKGGTSHNTSVVKPAAAASERSKEREKETG